MDVDWVLASYSVDPALDFKELSKALVDFSTSKLDEPERSQSASLTELDDLRRIVKVAYPSLFFDDGNIRQWLNLLTRPTLSRGVRLEKVCLPQGVCKGLKGPRFGLGGIRGMLNLEHTSCPLLCLMLDVKTSSSPRLLGEAAYEAALGGANVLLDDELLHDQSFCRLESRVSSISDGLERAQQETGLRYAYAANISSDHPELLERAEIALENGASCLMVCDAFMAIPEVKSLRHDPTLNAPIYVHSPQPPANFFSKGVLSLFLRIAGADLIYVDEEDPAETDILESLVKPLDRVPNFLPSLPVLSGPKDPGSFKDRFAKFGCDVAILIKYSVGKHDLGGVREYVNNYVNAVKNTFT